MIVLELILGWLIADLFSGIVHWAGDSDSLGNTKVMKWLANFNTDHHAQPLAIVSERFVQRNISSWIGTSIISTVWFLIFGWSPILITMILGGLMVSEVHRWAHVPSKAPEIVKMIQKTGIFQSPKHHALHHRPPHNWRFCLLTNFVNPVLDLIPRKEHD